MFQTVKQYKNIAIYRLQILKYMIQDKNAFFPTNNNNKTYIIIKSLLKCQPDFDNILAQI